MQSRYVTSEEHISQGGRGGVSAGQLAADPGEFWGYRQIGSPTRVMPQHFRAEGREEVTRNANLLAGAVIVLLWL